MKIILAETAGFCFGVDNAVKKAFDTSNKKEYKTYTLGELIHNPQVIEQLKEAGVIPVDFIDQIQLPANVIIRAHGIGENMYRELFDKDVVIQDATCPYVKRIHKLVAEKYKEGCQIIIVGDKNHPEVVGVNGWCSNKAFIVESKNEVEMLPDISKTVCVVSQTTITREKWQEILELINKKFAKVIKFDTICSATGKRQEEAEKISQIVDMMVVIGGKNSSNTQKLYEICRLNCPSTIMIESARELPHLDRYKINTIGITAGASTPDWVIKEVYTKMDEMLNKQENEQATQAQEAQVQEGAIVEEQEMSFKEAFEESMVSIRSGQIVKGKIIGYNTSEVFVDLGYKSDGTISMEEFIDDPDFDPEKDLKEGQEIDVYIQRINDGEGNIQLSKMKVDAIRGLEYIEEAFKNKTPIEAHVKEVVKGGVVANYKGARIFIPASQLSDRFIKNLDEFVGEKLKIIIIEFIRGKRKVIGSRKIIIQKEKALAMDEFWGNIEIGKEYTGKVKSLTDFGAFVDLGCVDGLIHISELSWDKVDHPSKVLKVGDEVKVHILKFDKETQKISLGYKKIEDNPWYKIDEKYNEGDVVKGKIVRLVPFGAFVELEPGVEGLVHISQISNVRLGKPDDVLSAGQEVEMKIIEVNSELKKISLSIKEVKPINPVTEGEGDVEKVHGNIPSKHTEEMTNTIGDKFEDLKLS